MASGTRTRTPPIARAPRWFPRPWPPKMVPSPQRRCATTDSRYGNCNKYAMHSSITNCQTYSGFGAALRPVSGGDVRNPVDISAYDGISFWAKTGSGTQRRRSTSSSSAPSASPPVLAARPPTPRSISTTATARYWQHPDHLDPVLRALHGDRAPLVPDRGQQLLGPELRERQFLRSTRARARQFPGVPVRARRPVQQRRHR